jgi:hypothetical protein
VPLSEPASPAGRRVNVIPLLSGNPFHTARKIHTPAVQALPGSGSRKRRFLVRGFGWCARRSARDGYWGKPTSGSRGARAPDGARARVGCAMMKRGGYNQQEARIRELPSAP